MFGEKRNKLNLFLNPTQVHTINTKGTNLNVFYYFTPGKLYLHDRPKTNI